MGASSGSDPHRLRATPEDLLAQSLWLRRLARSLVVDASSADDLVQDAWVAALKSPPDGDRPLRPWLARVVHNLVRTRHRADTARGERESSHVVRDHAPSASESIEAIDLQRVLLDAVEALSEPQRSTIVRHYFKGLTSQEIARQEGVADSTVRWRLGQAIETLRHKLDARHAGDRNAWLGALLPFAHRADVGTSIGTATATTAVGGIVMTFWMKALFVAAAVLVGSIGVLWATRTPVSPLPTLTKSEETRVVSELDALAGANRSTVDATRSGAPASTIDATSTANATSPSPATSTRKESTVEARTLDRFGVAIAGAQLTCMDQVDVQEITREQAPSASTDLAGRVRLRVTPADRPQAHGWGTSSDDPEAYELHLEISAPRRATQLFHVTLHPGRTESLGDVVLLDAGDVSCRTVDEHGNPVENVDVRLVLPDLTLEELDQVPQRGLFQKTQKAFTRSASDGTLAFHDVPVGFYRAWATRDGWLRAVSEPFEIRTGQALRLLNLVVPVDTRAVRGVVLGLDGQPLPKAELEVFERGSWIGLDSDEHGAFVVNEIAGPDVDLYAHGLDRGPEGPDPGQLLVRHVPAGTSGLVLQLMPSASTDVVVHDLDGNPIDKILLGVSDHFGNRAVRSSDLKQRRIRAPGKPFYILVQATGYADEDIGPFESAQLPDRVEVVMKRNAIVAGRVTIDGVPVSQVRITAREALFAESSWTRNGFPLRIGSEGADWKWTQPDGTFDLQVTKPARWIVVAHMDGWARFESEPFDVSPTRGRENIEIALDHGGSVSGLVKGFTGATQDPTFVTLSRGVESDETVRIAADGTFAVGNLTPGTWLLRLTRTEHPVNYRQEAHVPPNSDNLAVAVRASETTHVELDARTLAVPAVTGHLALRGAEVAGWAATLTLSGMKPDAWSEKNGEHVAADGAFRIVADEIGAHHLTLASPSTSDRADTIEQDVELAHGENAWNLDIPTGSVLLPATASGEIVLTWNSPSGASWTAHVRKPSGGGLAVGGVPAGNVRIDLGDHNPSEVLVRAGEPTAMR